MTLTRVFPFAVTFLLGGLCGFLAKPSRPVETPVVIKESSSTLVKAQEIMFPLIDFEKTTLVEATDFLRARIIELSYPGHGDSRDYGLNFIVNDPNETARMMTIRLKDTRLDHVCGRIAQAAGVTVSFDEDAIVFSGRDQ